MAVARGGGGAGPRIKVARLNEVIGRDQTAFAKLNIFATRISPEKSYPYERRAGIKKAAVGAGFAGSHHGSAHDIIC